MAGLKVDQPKIGASPLGARLPTLRSTMAGMGIPLAGPGCNRGGNGARPARRTRRRRRRPPRRRPHHGARRGRWGNHPLEPRPRACRPRTTRPRLSKASQRGGAHEGWVHLMGRQRVSLQHCSESFGRRLAGGGAGRMGATHKREREHGAPLRTHGAARCAPAGRTPARRSGLWFRK